jgi:hypothetical protein
LELITESQEIIGKASSLAVLLAEKIAQETEVSIKTLLGTEQIFLFLSFLAK